MISLVAAVLAFVLAQVGILFKRSLDRSEAARGRRESFASELLLRALSWTRTPHTEPAKTSETRIDQPDLRIPEELVLNQPLLTRRLVVWFRHEEWHLMALLELHPRDTIHEYNFFGADPFRRRMDEYAIRRRLERGLRQWMRGNRIRTWFLTSPYSGDHYLMRLTAGRLLVLLWFLFAYFISEGARRIWGALSRSKRNPEAP